MPTVTVSEKQLRALIETCATWECDNCFAKTTCQLNDDQTNTDFGALVPTCRKTLLTAFGLEEKTGD